MSEISCQRIFLDEYCLLALMMLYKLSMQLRSGKYKGNSINRSLAIFMEERKFLVATEAWVGALLCMKMHFRLKFWLSIDTKERSFWLKAQCIYLCLF